MVDGLNVDRPITIDLLDTSGAPALSSTSDKPVVETKPDAQNEGAPPAAATPEPEEVKEEVKTDSESATEPEDEPSANDEPRKAKGVQKRLDELVRQREEAERRAEAEKAEKLRLLAMLEAQQKPQQPPEQVETTEPIRPSRSDYDDPDAYDDALLRYARDVARHEAEQHIKQERDAIEAKLAQERANAESEAAMARFNERAAAFKSKTPDFDAVAGRDDVEVTITMAQVIVESDLGPQLQYYLGQNPDEAARIRALPDIQQLRELARIEGRLSVPSAPAPISAAPKPIKPIPAATEPVDVDPENESMDAYAARRRKEQGWADPMRRH